MERSRHLLGFIRPVVGGQQKSDAFFAAGVLTRNFHRTPTSPTHSLARASAPLPCARPRVPSLQASRLSPVRHVRHNATVADASEPAVKGAGQVPKPGSEGVMEEPRPANGDADAAGAIVPEDEELTTRRGTVPSLEMTFSCKPCGYRSTHRVSKQGYLHGTVLISCPKCKARHLISDHLKIFRDKRTTIEDILKEKGELFKTGQLDPSGDFELWGDGTKTRRHRYRVAGREGDDAQPKPSDA